MEHAAYRATAEAPAWPPSPSAIPGTRALTLASFSLHLPKFVFPRGIYTPWLNGS